MDYSRYGKETVSKLDIIGSYIVDLYYNRLYNKAISLKESSGKSITESYHYVLSTYIKNIDGIDFYKTFLHGVYFYTTISTKYQNMSHKQCLDFFVIEFIPSQYMNSMTEIQKNNIMFMVLKNTIRKFTESIIEKYLSMIIDEHLDTDNIPVLQDEFLKFILMEREHSYNQFISSEKPKLTNGTLESSSEKTVTLLKNELNTKKKLVMSIDQKNKQIESLLQQYKKCLMELKTYKSKLDHFKKMNKELRIMIDTQIHSFKIMKNELETKQSIIEKLQKENKKLYNDVKKDNTTIKQSLDTLSDQEDQEDSDDHENTIVVSSIIQPIQSIQSTQGDHSEFSMIPTTRYLSDDE